MPYPLAPKRNNLSYRQHLFELTFRDAPTLQKVMPVGAKFYINIAPEHLHSDSFKEDMHCSGTPPARAPLFSYRAGNH